MKIYRKKRFSSETGKTHFSILFFFFTHFGTFSNIYRNRTKVSIEMLKDPAIGSNVMMSYIVSSCN